MSQYQKEGQNDSFQFGLENGRMRQCSYMFCNKKAYQMLKFKKYDLWFCNNENCSIILWKIYIGESSIELKNCFATSKYLGWNLHKKITLKDLWTLNTQ